MRPSKLILSILFGKGRSPTSSVIINKDGSWDSEFKRLIGGSGIKSVLAGVSHPRTNGRLEKWFDTYQRFRGEMGVRLFGL
jgi:transposase InsO family protein